MADAVDKPDLAQKLCDALPHPATFNDYRYAQGTIERVREAGLIVIDPDDPATIERMACAAMESREAAEAGDWMRDDYPEEARESWRRFVRSALRAAGEERS